MIEQFIETFADRGYQFAYRLCGSAEEAKELVQESFYRVIRKWDQYDRTQPLESWFLTILRHVYYDSLRRSERRLGVSMDAPLQDPLTGEEVPLAEAVADPGEESALDRLTREETAAEVRSAIDALSLEHRAVLLLADLDGRNYEEISAVLDCPQGTVRSRLCRARAALKRELIARGSEAAR